MSSLCYYDAAMKRKSNEISEDVYVRSIAAHATGLRHGINNLCNGDSKPENFDPENTSNYDYIHYASNVQSIDRFASCMAICIRDFDIVEDTTPLAAALAAYRAQDGTRLTASLREMDSTYNGASSSRHLGRSLATLALEQQNTDMLKVILDERIGQYPWDFQRMFDNLKHDGSNPNLVRLIESSDFESWVPPGKRFSDLHPLDIM